MDDKGIYSITRKTLSIILGVVFIGGCISPRILTKVEMDCLLLSNGLEHYDYTMLSNGTVRLHLDSGTVRDISFLKGVYLSDLSISNTLVNDLSPLKNMPLRSLSFSPSHGTNGINEVRHMKTLREINGMKPAYFWAAYDSGRFTDHSTNDWPCTSHQLYPRHKHNKISDTNSPSHQPSDDDILIRVNEPLPFNEAMGSGPVTSPAFLPPPLKSLPDLEKGAK